MNWYLAKLVFQIHTTNVKGMQQFDEQLRLISAADYNEAFNKAKAIGLKEEDEFLNAVQQKVKWQFIDICELIEIKKLEDGMEMFSGIKEIDEAANYIYTVKQKSTSIQKRRINQPALAN